MTRYRYDGTRPKGDRWVEITPGLRVMSKVTEIIPDVKPYQSMITGEVIGGRRQHREHLNRHGCEEVGNEKPDIAPNDYKPDRGAIRDAVREAKRALEWGEQPTLQRLREESPKWRREMGIE